MNIFDIAIIAAVAVCVAAAVISIVKHKKRGGGCCGDCASCRRDCAQGKDKR